MGEPGNLILFAASVAYIPFSMATGKLAFIGMGLDEDDLADEEIEFFAYTIDADHFYLLRVLCWVGLLAFPIAFTIGFTAYFHILHKTKKLEYHDNFGKECWCDPVCFAAKVPWTHWLRRAFPVTPAFLDRYVRMCFPILTKDGEKMVVEKEDKAEDDKAAEEDKGGPIFGACCIQNPEQEQEGIAVVSEDKNDTSPGEDNTDKNDTSPEGDNTKTTDSPDAQNENKDENN